MAASRFVRAAARLLEIIGFEHSVVIGGVAVNAYGFVRGTRDVDILVTISLDEARRRLKAAGVETRHFKGSGGDLSCLKGVVGVTVAGHVLGVPFDVLPQLVPVDLARAVVIEARGCRLQVVDIEALFRLKFHAGGVKDLHDVAVLARRRPEWLASARALAAADPDTAARLEAMLDDRHLRAQARDEARMDRLLDRFARRQGRDPGERDRK